MKRLLIIIIFICSFLLAQTSIAEPLKVGGQMPNMETEPDYIKPWNRIVDDVLSKGGERHFRDIDSIHWTMEAFLSCGSVVSKKPFAFYLSKLNVVYLDLNMDGIIDKMVIDPTKTIASTAPECL